jgi:hypothetical protein
MIINTEYINGLIKVLKDTYDHIDLEEIIKDIGGEVIYRIDINVGIYKNLSDSKFQVVIPNDYNDSYFLSIFLYVIIEHVDIGKIQEELKKQGHIIEKNKVIPFIINKNISKESINVFLDYIGENYRGSVGMSGMLGAFEELMGNIKEYLYYISPLQEYNYDIIQKDRYTKQEIFDIFSPEDICILYTNEDDTIEDIILKYFNKVYELYWNIFLIYIGKKNHK